MNKHQLRSKLKSYIGEKTTLKDIYLDYYPAHESLVLSKYWYYIEIIEDVIDITNKGLQYVSLVNKKERPLERLRQFLLILHNLKTVVSSFWLLNQGSYEDSLALIRSSFEWVLLVLYMSENPLQPNEDWLEKYFDRKKSGFKIKTFIENNLNLPDLFGFYHLMSSHAHKNWQSVLREYVDIHKNGWRKEVRTLTYEYSDDLYQVWLNTILFTIWNYLIFLELFLLNNANDNTLEWFEMIKVAEDFLFRTLIDHKIPNTNDSNLFAKILPDMKNFYINLKK